jgi:hypothetical protein
VPWPIHLYQQGKAVCFCIVDADGQAEVEILAPGSLTWQNCPGAAAASVSFRSHRVT